MCCNNHLEDLMTQEIQSVFNSVPDFNSCNINKIANAVQVFFCKSLGFYLLFFVLNRLWTPNSQKAAEQRFNRTFDVIVGIGDYFSKSHFNVDHICKVTMHDRFPFFGNLCFLPNQFWKKCPKSFLLVLFIRYVLAYETVPRGQALKFNGTLSELDPRLYGGQTTGTGNSSRTSPPAAAAELGFRRKRSSKGMC